MIGPPKPKVKSWLVVGGGAACDSSTSAQGGPHGEAELDSLAAELLIAESRAVGRNADRDGALVTTARPTAGLLSPLGRSTAC